MKKENKLYLPCELYFTLREWGVDLEPCQYEYRKFIVNDRILQHIAQALLSDDITVSYFSFATIFSHRFILDKDVCNEHRINYILMLEVLFRAADREVKDTIHDIKEIMRRAGIYEFEIIRN